MNRMSSAAELVGLERADAEAAPPNFALTASDSVHQRNVAMDEHADHDAPIGAPKLSTANTCRGRS